MDLMNKIAKEISEREDVPNTYDCNSHRTYIMVAQDVYGANIEQAIEIADIIQKEYLK